MTTPSFDEIPEGSAGAADSRVYGQVTLRLPAKGVGEPSAAVMKDALNASCSDCNVNVEVYWEDLGDLADPFDRTGEWRMVVAHDAECPWMASAERLWELKLSCGHTELVWTFIGDFDYEAVHVGLPTLCPECRFELNRPLDECLVERLSVRMLPKAEWPDA